MYCTKCEVELDGFNRYCARCGAPTPIAKFDLDSESGIAAISIPRYKALGGISSPVNNIEYILQRKATIHKKNGRIDLAIACLRKSNELFPYSNFDWSEKDYMRLVEYLKLDRQFDEARAEEKRIIANHPELFLRDQRNPQIQKLASEGFDLIYIHPVAFCPLCSVYGDRVYSISGKSKKYPALSSADKRITFARCPCCDCWISVGPFYDEFNLAGKSIFRPYKDTRTKELRDTFDKEQEERRISKEISGEFDWLREHLPEITPKSVGTYRRWKNEGSVKFQNLREAAARKGFGLKNKQLRKDDMACMYRTG